MPGGGCGDGMEEEPVTQRFPRRGHARVDAEEAADATFQLSRGLLDLDVGVAEMSSVAPGTGVVGRGSPVRGRAASSSNWGGDGLELTGVSSDEQRWLPAERLRCQG